MYLREMTIMKTLGILIPLLPFLPTAVLTSQLLPACENVKTEDTVCAKTGHYDKRKLPKAPTEIFPELLLKDIHEINEKSHTLTFFVDITISWQDHRLSLSGNQSKVLKYPQINYLKNHIWVPTWYFSNTLELKTPEGSIDKHLLRFGNFYQATNGEQYVVFNDRLRVTIACKMNFTNFPFDHQHCEWILRSRDLTTDKLFMSTIVFYTSNGYQWLPVAQNESISFDSSGLPHDIEIQPMEPVTFMMFDHSEFSFARVKFNLRRKSEEFNKLLISYYFPSGAFATLSLFSYFIKPEIVSIIKNWRFMRTDYTIQIFQVPGRMGMLVTVFLVVTVLYGSVEAPPSRGFSFIELWSIGVQIPILFALLEYGIILGFIKFKGSKVEVKYFAEGTKLEDIFKMADLISFICSLTFILIFNIYYIITCQNVN